MVVGLVLGQGEDAGPGIVWVMGQRFDASCLPCCSHVVDLYVVRCGQAHEVVFDVTHGHA